MKLLVRNLSRITTEATLRAKFELYGTVSSCSIVVEPGSGRSKGFGFVEMPKPGDAKAAVKCLNGLDLEGSRLRVKKADSKATQASRPQPGSRRAGEKPTPSED